MASNAAVCNFFENQAHQVSLAQYRASIHSHLVELEMLEETQFPLIPLSDWPALRSSSLNSLYDVTTRLGWQSATFSLAVRLLDIYGTRKPIERPRYRMVAFCCLWIASKYIENKPKGKLCDALLLRAGYTKSDRSKFLATESDILNTMGWNLSLPTTESFVDLFLNNAEPNNTERRLGALFLCELAHFKPEIAREYTSSAVAASAILVTNVAMLNLRHIRPRRFSDLETLLLKAAGSMPTAVRYRYLEAGNGPRPIVRNLMGLAVSYAKERLAFRLGRTPQLAAPALEAISKALPISPISSPTNRTSPVTPPLLQGRHGRSHSAVFMMPTPGTTPHALSFTPVTTPLRPALEEPPAKKRRV